MKLCIFSLVPRFEDEEKRNVIEVQGSLSLTDEGIELAKAILSSGIVTAQKPSQGIKTNLEALIGELGKAGEGDFGDLTGLFEKSTHGKKQKFSMIKLCDRIIRLSQDAPAIFDDAGSLIADAHRLRAEIYDSLTEEQRGELPCAHGWDKDRHEGARIDPVQMSQAPSASGGEVTTPIDDHSGAQPSNDEPATETPGKTTAPRRPPA